MLFLVNTHVASDSIVLAQNYQAESVDHYSIVHAGTGVTCQKETILFSSHAKNHDQIIPLQDTLITISTNTGKGNWSLASGMGIFDNGLQNDGVASYTMSSKESTFTLYLDYPDPFEKVQIDVHDEFTKVRNSNKEELPTIIFSLTGLQFIADQRHNAIGLQIAGKSNNLQPDQQLLKLQAIQTDSHGVCEEVVHGPVKVKMAYECMDPEACSLEKHLGVADGLASLECVSGLPEGTAINGNEKGFVNDFTEVLLTFDDNGEAMFSFVYCDVGKIKLHAKIEQEIASTYPEVIVGGVSNSFVTRPFGFEVLAEGNPGATNHNDRVYKKAGESFFTTARAVLWEEEDDLNHDGIPDNHDDNLPGNNNADLSNNWSTINFGNENKPEGVSLGAVLNQPSTDLPPPLGGTDPGLSGDVTMPTITNGSGSASVQFNEVGIIEISAQVSDGDYLGIEKKHKGATAKINSKSGYVGRFIPDRIRVEANTPSFSDGCNSGNFTYLDQPFGFEIEPEYVITALNIHGHETKNYGGNGTLNDFWKLDEPELSSEYFVDLVKNTSVLQVTNPGKTVFFNTENYDGRGYLKVSSASLTYSKPYTPITYFNSKINLTVSSSQLTDNDNICFDSQPDGFCDSYTIYNVSGTDLLWGRLMMSDAFGVETEDMLMLLSVQYMSETGFTINTDDFCTKADVVMVSESYTGDLGPQETCIQDSGSPGMSSSGCPTQCPVGRCFHEPAVAGEFNLYLKASGLNNYGGVQLTASVEDGNWLQYDWQKGDNAHNDNPRATANFGLYRGNNRIINWRELYR